MEIFTLSLACRYENWALCIYKICFYSNQFKTVILWYGLKFTWVWKYAGSRITISTQPFLHESQAYQCKCLQDKTKITFTLARKVFTRWVIKRFEVFPVFQCTVVKLFFWPFYKIYPAFIWSQTKCLLHSFPTICHNLEGKVAKTVHVIKYGPNRAKIYSQPSYFPNMWKIH